ncbi:hypothetical protein D3C87_1603770 [compost metagenome]
MAIDAITRLKVRCSPNIKMAAVEAIIGTVSCTDAAGAALSEGKMLYQIAYPTPEEIPPDKTAKMMPCESTEPAKGSSSNENGAAFRKFPAVAFSGSPCFLPSSE